MKLLRSLDSALPSPHLKHSYISKEDSEHVLNIFRTILLCMPDDSRFLPKAVEIAVKSTGIGKDMVRHIWRHFVDYALVYETPHISTAGHSVEDQAALAWLEVELPRLALRGTMRTIKGIQLMLEKKFGPLFTTYRTEKLMRALGFVYGKATIDWTIGMTSPRRQRRIRTSSTLRSCRQQ